jgi:hypothetical protein
VNASLPINDPEVVALIKGDALGKRPRDRAPGARKRLPARDLAIAPGDDDGAGGIAPDIRRVVAPVLPPQAVEALNDTLCGHAPGTITLGGTDALQDTGHA